MATATEDELAIRRANDLPDTEDEPGRSIDDMADDGPDAEPEAPTPPSQLAIPGTRDKVTARVGGRVPDDSQLRIMGGRRPITGEYEKGTRLTVLADVVIREIDFVDHDDEWGTVSKTTRAHKGRLLTVQPASADVLAKALLDSSEDGFAGARAVLEEVARTRGAL